MNGHVGDRLIMESGRVGEHRRIGVITEVRHFDGSPPYLVKWLDSGHESLVYPGPDAHVEATGADGETAR